MATAEVLRFRATTPVKSRCGTPVRGYTPGLATPGPAHDVAPPPRPVFEPPPGGCLSPIPGPIGLDREITLLPLPAENIASPAPSPYTPHKKGSRSFSSTRRSHEPGSRSTKKKQPMPLGTSSKDLCSFLGLQEAGRGAEPPLLLAPLRDACGEIAVLSLDAERAVRSLSSGCSGGRGQRQRRACSSGAIRSGERRGGCKESSAASEHQRAWQSLLGQTASTRLSSRTGRHTASSACSDPLPEVETPKAAPPSEQLKWNWDRGNNVGNGSFGTVFKARITETGQIVAVKEARINENDDAQRKYRDALRRELDICAQLDHPHIVRCFGHDYVEDHLYVYLEYLPGGSLRASLNEFGPISGAVLQRAVRSTLLGLNYLHTHSPPVVHRDLKGANILVDTDFHIKLTDFGCSKCDTLTRSFSSVGSMHWIAPEVLQVPESGYHRSIDIWSFGCVMIEMVTAEDPWGRAAFDNQFVAMREIGWNDRTPPIPAGLTEEGRDLVLRCLKRAPDERPPCNALLEHAFVADVARPSSRRSSGASRPESRRGSSVAGASEM